MIAIAQALLKTSDLLQEKIASLLPTGDDKLSQAMRYSALSPGKRLRPFMLVAAANIFEVNHDYSMRVAAVVELIHSYSLIHDDLPAMDDDDYRRGSPSCHRKFDEATAILAGDSLLTIAFEILAEEETHPDSNIRCKLIRILAEHIGYNGMAGGQMYDLIYEREILANYPEIVKMHWMKTSRLFIASCLMGATLGSASAEACQHLTKYAELFGLAFQFIDDLEDDQDLLNNNNIVKIIGYNKTKEEARNLITQARTELKFFKSKGETLDLLALQLLNSI